MALVFTLICVAVICFLLFIIVKTVMSRKK
ncbi:hypothetical protein HIMB59_00008470 [alpha proteobacterium HIMB59]|nr:hypothetical protein HIMB59_00008470 [alpha proteobacterium HIMB59]